MSIKRRLTKLEDGVQVGRDSAKCVFITSYEGEDAGTIESPFAQVVWGSGESFILQSQEGESTDAFNARVDATSKLSAAEARDQLTKA